MGKEVSIAKRRFNRNYIHENYSDEFFIEVLNINKAREWQNVKDVEELIKQFVIQLTDKVDELSPDADWYYDLDLDSLDMAEIIAQLEEKLGIDVKDVHKFIYESKYGNRSIRYMASKVVSQIEAFVCQNENQTNKNLE